MSATRSKAGSPNGTQRSFSSGPFSSSMWNTPIARTRMRQPGKVGSETSTSASSGSPSSASVPSTKPYSAGYVIAVKRRRSSTSPPSLSSHSYLLRDPEGISTKTTASLLMSRARGGRHERVLEIHHEIVGRLDPDREADEVRRRRERRIGG